MSLISVVARPALLADIGVMAIPNPVALTVFAIIGTCIVLLMLGILLFRYLMQAQYEREARALRAALRAHYGRVLGIEEAVREWLDVELTVERKIRLIKADFSWEQALLPSTTVITDYDLDTMAVVYHQPHMRAMRRKTAAAARQQY